MRFRSLIAIRAALLAAALLFVASSAALPLFGQAARRPIGKAKPTDEEVRRELFATQQQSGRGIRLDKEVTVRYRVGVVVQAMGGPCRGLFGTVPIPTEWPEQQVTVIDEDITPNARVTYRFLDNGVKQMLVSIPALNNGDIARAVVTLRVSRRMILPPEDTSGFLIPTKTDRTLLPYLSFSPYIESTSPKIKEIARDLMKEHEGEPAWKQVEAIYDFTRSKVEYRNGDLKGALAALKDGYGDCEELTSLFIAICRAANIPARSVWVPEHCYPEFYLVDKEGNGYWFPAQSAGDKSFGGIPETRPVLQKGDNFRVPEKGREPQRYVAEFLKGAAINGGGKPQVEFLRDVLPGAE